MPAPASSSSSTVSAKGMVRVELPNARHQHTQRLKTLTGEMRANVVRARESRDQKPVTMYCGELGSVLVFNKHYGRTELVPLRDGSGTRVTYVTSFFEPQCRRQKARHWLTTYEWAGYAANGEPVPMRFCKRSQALVSAGTPYRWRVFVWEPDGAREAGDDPPGVVAFEGWPMREVEVPATLEGTDKTYTDTVFDDIEDEDEMIAAGEALSARIRALVKRGPVPTVPEYV